jgi:ankyrin repeat-rich membrane spanning protein
MEPMLEMDRDEKKLDVFLSLHKKSLTVANMKIFLPFTINLDPYIKKVIKEEVQNLEELGVHILSAAASPLGGHLPATSAPLTRRQAVGLSKRMTAAGPDAGLHSQVPYPSSFMTPPPLLSGPVGWPPAYGHQPSSQHGYPLYPPPATFHHLNLQNMMGRQQAGGMKTTRPLLPPELQGLVLSALGVEQVCLLVRSIEHINLTMLDTYCATIAYNNITGRVLLHCQLDELRNVLNMNFGDWELFKILLAAMREDELLGGAVHQHHHHHSGHGDHHDRQYQSDDDLYDPGDAVRRRAESAGKGRKPSSVERQVRINILFCFYARFPTHHYLCSLIRPIA